MVITLTVILKTAVTLTLTLTLGLFLVKNDTKTVSQKKSETTMKISVKFCFRNNVTQLSNPGTEP